MTTFKIVFTLDVFFNHHMNEGLTLLIATDPFKCINDQTLRSDTEFCRTSLLKLSDKCPTKLSDIQRKKSNLKVI
jgi:hypothetical protein